MAKLSREIVILSARRTAFGTLSGSLKGVSATDLAVVASKAALADAKVAAADVGHVIFGNVQQTSADAIYLARHVGLKAGLPITTPALTVNRLCGSGFQAVINGAEQILMGETEVALVGGTENMTQAPHVIRGARDGFAFGRAPALEDSLAAASESSRAGARPNAKPSRAPRITCGAWVMFSVPPTSATSVSPMRICSAPLITA